MSSIEIPKASDMLSDEKLSNDSSSSGDNVNRDRDSDRTIDSDRHDRERDRDSRSRRSRSRDRDGGRRDTRDRDRDRRSRSRDRYERDRDRDRDGDRDRERERERERSLSPISRRAKVRREAQQRALASSSDRYWDGFQWVKKSSMEGVSEAIMGVDLGHQRDRRIYVGNLPDGMTGQELKDFMNEALSSYTLAGADGDITAVNTTEPPPPAVTSIWMSGDGKYGFLEMFSANLAQISMSLNGLQYNGATLRIARPKTYSEQYNGAGGGGPTSM